LLHEIFKVFPEPKTNEKRLRIIKTNTTYPGRLFYILCEHVLFMHYAVITSIASSVITNTACMHTMHHVWLSKLQIDEYVVMEPCLGPSSPSII